MSRKAEQNRVIHHDNKLAVEQTSIYDDSLLPPADELAKLKELDPDIINWVKKRTEIEQDARIKFNENKVKLMDKNMKQIFIQNIVCLHQQNNQWLSHKDRRNHHEILCKRILYRLRPLQSGLS